jgi:transcriptional regulator with XRE-family HTH domain
MRTAAPPSPFNVTLGTRVRARRLAQGMSKEALAAALDVSHFTVWGIEHGNGCRSQTLPRLALALDVSLDYLVGFTNDPTLAREADAPAALALVEAGA